MSLKYYFTDGSEPFIFVDSMSPAAARPSGSMVRQASQSPAPAGVVSHKHVRTPSNNIQTFQGALDCLKSAYIESKIDQFEKNQAELEKSILISRLRRQFFENQLAQELETEKKLELLARQQRAYHQKLVADAVRKARLDHLNQLTRQLQASQQPKPIAATATASTPA
ncbi:hypothetical protein AYI68_g2316, partial [Smittium mucronatum]